MKKTYYIIFILGLIFGKIFYDKVLEPHLSYNSNEYIGTWQNGNVTYTFTPDSLYINEIGIEGLSYKYICKDNFVYYQNEVDKVNNIVEKIHCSVNDNKLYVTINNYNTYIFNKK